MTPRQGSLTMGREIVFRANLQRMHAPVIACLLAGIALYLVSAVWIVILAFRKNFWLGCGCVAFPILQLIYVITNWRESHWAFYVHIGGYVLICSAVAMAYFSGYTHPIDAQ